MTLVAGCIAYHWLVEPDLVLPAKLLSALPNIEIQLENALVQLLPPFSSSDALTNTSTDYRHSRSFFTTFIQHHVLAASCCFRLLRDWCVRSIFEWTRRDVELVC